MNGNDKHTLTWGQQTIGDIVNLNYEAHKIDTASQPGIIRNYFDVVLVQRLCPIRKRNENPKILYEAKSYNTVVTITFRPECMWEVCEQDTGRKEKKIDANVSLTVLDLAKIYTWEITISMSAALHFVLIGAPAEVISVFYGDWEDAPDTFSGSFAGLRLRDEAWFLTEEVFGEPVYCSSNEATKDMIGLARVIFGDDDGIIGNDTKVIGQKLKDFNPAIFRTKG